MRRKVIQIANSTQMISLPRKWVKEKGIQKGDELEVDIVSSSLKISTLGENSQEILTCEFDVSGLGEYAKKLVGAIYKKGYDEMKIKYKTEEELQAISDVLTYSCIGFEIIDHHNNVVLAKRISNPLYGRFNEMFDRMILIILTMVEQGCQSIIGEDLSNISENIDLDQTVNKFADFCRRGLNRESKGTIRHVAPLYCIVENLEKYADEVKAVYRLIVSDPKLLKHKKAKQNITKILLKTADALKMFHALYKEFDPNSIDDFKQITRKCKKELNLLLEKCDSTELRYLIHLKSARDKVDEILGPYLTFVV